MKTKVSNVVERHPETIGLVVILLLAFFLLWWHGWLGALIWRPVPERVWRAKMDLRNLDQAVQALQNKFGKLPESLESMTKRIGENMPPILREGELTDPWGRAYNYDPTSTDPKSGRPLIWTEGPEPGKPGSKITNWDYVDGGT